MNERNHGGNLVISFLTLRKIIGVLGVAFAFVLFLGAMLVFDTGIRRAISNYYYTGMRDVFVGTLFVIGFFMLSYRGYDRRDAIAGNLACLFAVGIALFPVAPEGDVSAVERVLDYVHTACTAGFFGALIYFCLCLFTRTDPSVPRTPQKKLRDRIYRACGYTMIACMLLIGGYLFIEDSADALRPYTPAFWLEGIAIVAFGASWLVKGEAILKDRPGGGGT